MDDQFNNRLDEVWSEIYAVSAKLKKQGIHATGDDLIKISIDIHHNMYLRSIFLRFSSIPIVDNS